MSRKPKPFTVEEAGIRVRVYLNGGRWWADVRHGAGRIRQTLKTSEKSTAETNAKALAAEIAKRKLLGVQPDTVTLEQIFIAYNDHALALLSDERQKWIRSIQGLFLAAWDADLIVRRLTQLHVESYCAARRAGTLTPLKATTAPDGRTKGRKPIPVKDGTLNADFRMLSTVFNFALEHEVEDRLLLTRNPLHKLKLPRERNPRRPVASHARFTLTMDHVDPIDPKGRLRCILALVRYSGRRIDAVCNLRVSDVLLTPARMRAVLAETGRDERLADAYPHGAIRWRAENDKQGFDELAPLSAPAREAVDAYLRSAGRLGDAVLFAAPENDAAPIGRRLVTRWLLKAERAAGLPKLEQGCWHAYRRLWAVERKHLPDVDVAAAGGWRDTRALKVSYQQPDPATMLRVVEAI